MPALKGSLTYATFYVDGALPDDFRERYTKAVRLRAMRPLEPDDDALERTGWCRIGDPFTTDLGYEDVFYNEFVNLGFRTDRWVVPGPLLRAKLRDAESAYLARKGRERLGRKERAELKELVQRKLRKQLVPSMRVVDLSWDTGLGLVRFFSQSPKTGAAAQELFAKTFGLKLVPQSPYTLAARLGLNAAEESAWREIAATELGDGAGAAGAEAE